MSKHPLKLFVLGGALVAGGLVAVAVGDLIAFQPNTPIKSADVNQNFSTLRTAVAALEAQATALIGTDRLSDGAVTLPKLAVGGSAADGKVLKLQSGALVWADDILGSPGTTYSAGPGLSLSGSTFSIGSGAVTTAMLANAAVSGAKVALPLTLTGAAASGNVLQVNSSTAQLNEGAVVGSNTGAGNGVRGTSTVGSGVYGQTNGTGLATAGVFGQAIGTGTGVVASSTDGTGLYTGSASGSALEVEGPIRVRGNAARRAAFVHLKTVANTAGPNQTCTNLTDPSAILTVTHNYTASGDQTLNSAIGVFRNTSGAWCIFRQDGAALANGMAFNVTVIYSAP